MKRNPATTIRTVDLGYDQMLVLDDRPGARVHVLYGGVWLTEEGRPDDVFAKSGQVIALRSRKRALLGALGPTRVELLDSCDSRPRPALLARVKRAAQRLLQAADSAATAARGTVAAAGLFVGVAVPLLVVLGITAAPSTAALLA